MAKASKSSEQVQPQPAALSTEVQAMADIERALLSVGSWEVRCRIVRWVLARFSIPTVALLLALTACTTLPDGRRVLTPTGDAAIRSSTLDVLACAGPLAIAEVLAAVTKSARPGVDDYTDSGECYARRLGHRFDGLRESADPGASEAIGRELVEAIKVERRLGKVVTSVTEAKAAECEATARERLGGGHVE